MKTSSSAETLEKTMPVCFDNLMVSKGPKQLAHHDMLIPVTDKDSAIGAGWFIELHGKRLAELVDPMYVSGSQFWFSYVIKPLVDDATERASLFSKEFWVGGEVVFRSRKFGVIARNAFTANRAPDPDTRRISVRGLHLQLDPGPSIVEKIVGLFKSMK